MSELNDCAVEPGPEAVPAPVELPKLYHVSFRVGEQPKAASCQLPGLSAGELVMVQSDHGLEPGLIAGAGIGVPVGDADTPLDLLAIVRRATTEEAGRYQNLLQREAEARRFCQARIQDMGLEMKLLRVERYFNGGKIIFYFSAENRVDFRDLVKALVQEFRTRVEMRQIGVRHETQMLGGLGCCGRELCCSLFMKDFVPVSIKMAKEQDLPLNPAKISGVCNRLLCCLTHEYETYRVLKKGMPKLGRTIIFDNKSFKVTQCKTLNEEITIVAVDDPSDSRTLGREDWERGCTAPAPAGKEQGGGNAPAPMAGGLEGKSVPPPRRQLSGRPGPPGRQPVAGKPSPSRAPHPPGKGPRPGPPPRPAEGKAAPSLSKGDAPNKPGPGRPPRPRRGRGGGGPKPGTTP